MTGWRAIRMLALVGLSICVPGYAQAQSGVGVVAALVGEATVARGAVTQSQVLKMRDDVFPRDRISTKERSVVHVLMGGKALLTVRELSVVTVTEEGGRATVDLQSGKVGLAVLRARMKPGEVIEVQTPHAVAAVRGTVLVVEIVPGSAGGDQPAAGGSSTNVHLLHGKLDVSLRSNPGVAPVQLESLQTVTVSANTLGTMRPLSPAAAAAVTGGLRAIPPSQRALPEKFQTTLDARHQVLAVQTIEGLAGRGPAAASVKDRARKGRTKEAGLGQDGIALVADTGGGDAPENGSGLGAGSRVDGDAGAAGGRNGSGKGSSNNGEDGNGRGSGVASGLGGGNGRGSGIASGLGGGNGPGFSNGTGPVRNDIGALVKKSKFKK